MTTNHCSYAHIYGGIHRMHGATKWLLLFSTALARRGHPSDIYCTNLSIPLPYWFESRAIPLFPWLTANKEISGPRKLFYILFQVIGCILLPISRMRKTDFIVYHAEMGIWASLLGKVRFPSAKHIYYCYQPPRELYDLRDGTRKHFGFWYFFLLPIMEIYRHIDRWLVKRMDLVLVWSPEYENYARSIYGNIKIEQAPAAVDFGFIQDIENLDEKVGRLREKYGLTDPSLLLTVSALNWKKNLHLLVELVANLRTQGQPVQGVIVGEGPERANLEILASKSGISDSIVITGFISQEELPLFYHAADIVYFLEPNAAWTMSTIEAGAASKPVITAPGGSMETLVVNGVSGVIVPDVEDGHYLALKSLELLNDEIARQEMGRNNNRHSFRFSLEKATDRFLAFVEKIGERDTVCG